MRKKLIYGIIVFIGLVIMAGLIGIGKIEYSGAFGAFLVFVAALKDKIFKANDFEKIREKRKNEFENKEEEIENSMNLLEVSTDSLKNELEKNEWGYGNREYSEEEILRRLGEL